MEQDLKKVVSIFISNYGNKRNVSSTEMNCGDFVAEATIAATSHAATAKKTILFGTVLLLVKC